MILKNKKIIVTGGTMGIGLAVAKECAKEGAEITLIARNRPGSDRALSELFDSTKHFYIRTDVGNISEVKKIPHRFQVSGLDGLVNCAGIYGPIGKTGDVDLAELKRTLEINLLGTLYMCHTLLPLLKKSKGKIVNLAGGGAASPFPRYSAYALSKVAIVRLTENLALEYRPDRIDINAIAPGFVSTRLHQATLAAGQDQAGEQFFQKTKTEMERGGANPELAAQLAVFLLSNQSDDITGKLISAPWDPWQKKSFQKRLKSDPDFCTLRRIDYKFFGKL